jgi:hypothetical protein
MLFPLQDKTPADRRQARRKMDTFFVPMRDPLVDHTNPSLPDYFRWNHLEEAPVSAAARKFVLNLKKMGFKPDEWRDRHSRPLLLVAAQWNYVKLFKWLVAQGCSVQPDALGKQLVKTVRRRGYTVLGNFIREQLQANADVAFFSDWIAEGASKE